MYLACLLYITVKRFRLLQPYFGHLSCFPFGVCDMSSSRSAYNLNQSLVERLFISPFRKCYFFDLAHLSLDEFLNWLHGCGRNSRNVANK